MDNTGCGQTPYHLGSATPNLSLNQGAMSRQAISSGQPQRQGIGIEDSSSSRSSAQSPSPTHYNHPRFMRSPEAGTLPSLDSIFKAETSPLTPVAPDPNNYLMDGRITSITLSPVIHPYSTSVIESGNPTKAKMVGSYQGISYMPPHLISLQASSTVPATTLNQKIGFQASSHYSSGDISNTYSSRATSYLRNSPPRLALTPGETALGGDILGQMKSQGPSSTLITWRQGWEDFKRDSPLYNPTPIQRPSPIGTIQGGSSKEMTSLLEDALTSNITGEASTPPKQTKSTSPPTPTTPMSTITSTGVDWATQHGSSTHSNLYNPTLRRITQRITGVGIPTTGTGVQSTPQIPALAQRIGSSQPQDPQQLVQSESELNNSPMEWSTDSNERSVSATQQPYQPQRGIIPLKEGMSQDLRSSVSWSKPVVTKRSLFTKYQSSPEESSGSSDSIRVVKAHIERESRPRLQHRWQRHRLTSEEKAQEMKRKWEERWAFRNSDTYWLDVTTGMVKSCHHLQFADADVIWIQHDLKRIAVPIDDETHVGIEGPRGGWRPYEKTLMRWRNEMEN